MPLLPKEMKAWQLAVWRWKSRLFWFIWLLYSILSNSSTFSVVLFQTGLRCLRVCLIMRCRDFGVQHCTAGLCTSCSDAYICSKYPRRMTLHSSELPCPEPHLPPNTSSTLKSPTIPRAICILFVCLFFASARLEDSIRHQESTFTLGGLGVGQMT